jgi:hypothetical protein
MSEAVTPDQVAYKKRIGKLGDTPVYEVGLIGGLHLIMKAGSKAPLGAGPHPAVARHLARQRNPEIEYTMLQKGDWVDPALFQDILPQYEALTDQLASLFGE